MEDSEYTEGGDTMHPPARRRRRRSGIAETRAYYGTDSAYEKDASEGAGAGATESEYEAPRAARVPVASPRGGREIGADVMDLLATRAPVPDRPSAGAYGTHARASAAAAAASDDGWAVEPPPPSPTLRPSAARGAAAGTVILNEQADRYMREKGKVKIEETAEEFHFRRTQFRLAVRVHPVNIFLRKVQGLTSGTSDLYTLEGRGDPAADVEGEDTRARGVSVAPGGVEDDEAPPADPRGMKYSEPPGHDITGILRIDPRVYAAMHQAHLLAINNTRQVVRRGGAVRAVTAPSLRGARVENLVADNELVQTVFAQLTAALFLLNRSAAGTITLRGRLVDANAHTRDIMLVWLSRHARYERGRVRYVPDAGGGVSREGDFPRTPDMRWDPETGFDSVDIPAGLARSGGGDDANAARRQAYIPRNASMAV